MNRIKAARLALREGSPERGRQEDVARAVGVRAFTVSRWERGVQKPRPAQLRAVAKYLGVEVADLEGDV